MTLAGSGNAHKVVSRPERDYNSRTEEPGPEPSDLLHLCEPYPHKYEP